MIEFLISTVVPILHFMDYNRYTIFIHFKVDSECLNFSQSKLDNHIDDFGRGWNKNFPLKLLSPQNPWRCSKLPTALGAVHKRRRSFLTPPSTYQPILNYQYRCFFWHLPPSYRLIWAICTPPLKNWRHLLWMPPT